MIHFKELLVNLKYNIEIKNPFVLCPRCSRKEREKIIEKLGCDNPFIPVYAADIDCEELTIDLIEKYEGFQVLNMRFIQCKEAQIIRNNYLNDKLWVKRWIRNCKNGNIDL